MRRAALALLLLSAPASAQSLVAPEQLDSVLRDFVPQPGGQPLPCEVTPVAPALNFAFRFHAGYTFHVPLDQSRSVSSGWSVLSVIRPRAGGAPAYFLARHQLADATKTQSGFDVLGLYFLGVGAYTVEATLRDENRRVCRKEWPVVVKASRHDGRAVSALPPNAMREVSSLYSQQNSRPDDTVPLRLSVLLNAAAFSSRRTAMRTADRLFLLSALTGLVEHVPATRIRMVVFSLEQQREVFRDDDFSPIRLNRVAEAIDSLQLATVDVHVLQKPLGHVDFLTALIQRELSAPTPSDRVIFLGPPSRYENRIPAAVLKTAGGATPRFFYVRYDGARRPPPPSNIADSRPMGSGPMGGRGLGSSSQQESDPNDPPSERAPPPAAPRVPPPPTGTNSSSGDSGTTQGSRGANSSGGQAGGGGRGGAGGGGGGRNGAGLPPLPRPVEQQADIINQAVSRLKGKTLSIYSPADLAKAIQKVERR